MRLTKAIIQEKWDEVLTPLGLKCKISFDNKIQKYTVNGTLPETIFKFTLEFYNYQNSFHFFWFSGECSGTLLPYICNFVNALNERGEVDGR